MTIIEQLKSGERARLIPVLPDSKKEEKATASLLAAFRIIPEFAKSVLSDAGASIGTRAKIDCYTEVVFKHECAKGIRPDGLIVVHTGKKEWTALIESKIGNANLSCDQLEKYLTVARALGIDALITISNEYAVLPTHHPVNITKQSLKKVELYHFSWLSIISKAVILSDNKIVDDPEQAFLLSELIRYFRHSSSGVSALSKMSPDWREICDLVQRGAHLSSHQKEIEGAVSSWNQLLRYLSLQLSMATRSAVSVQLPRKLQSSPEQQIKQAIHTMVSSGKMIATLEIPNAAGPIQITADLMRRTVTFDIKLTSPQDVKRPTAAINWLTRQLKDVKAMEEIVIKAYWPRRTPMTMSTLSQAIDSPETLLAEGIKDIPKELEVSIVTDLAGRFRGARTFIEETERALLWFYDTIGEHLSIWVPKAPKIKPQMDNESGNENNQVAPVESSYEKEIRERFLYPAIVVDNTGTDS
ncbi:hypothetical protein [Spongiibacter sp.]|uniref:hypothetical protein n=1 Tax=Spongiibacter sp. TaxID=2024860 RepID=UPI00356646A3